MTNPKLAFNFSLILFFILLTACGGGPLPAAPSNLQVFANSGKITLTWQNISALATGFNIYRETVSSNLQALAFQKIAEVSGTTNFYEDETFSVNESYRYAVTAKSASGESARTVSDTPISIDNKLPSITYSLELAIDTVTLTASVTDSDGSIESVIVDWGDGEQDTVTSDFASISLSHSYADFSTYSFSISATDNAAGVTTQTEDLEVTAFPTEGLLAEFTEFIRVPSERKMQDSSGNDNNGFLNTSNSQELETATDRFGFSEKAIDFRGQDAGQSSVAEVRSDTESGNLNYNDALSLALWTNGGSGYLIGPKDTTRVFNSAGLVKSGSELSFEVPLANNEEGYSLTDSTETTGAWVFYVVTIERTGSSANLKLYKNAVLVNEDSFAEPELLLTGNPIIVGARANYTGGGGGSDFQGVLDDIRIYDRALVASEINSLYTDGGWTGNP